MKSIQMIFLYIIFYGSTSENLNNCHEIADMVNNINNQPFYSIKIFSCIVPYGKKMIEQSNQSMIDIHSNNTFNFSKTQVLETDSPSPAPTAPSPPSPAPTAPSPPSPAPTAPTAPSPPSPAPTAPTAPAPTAPTAPAPTAPTAPAPTAPSPDTSLVPNNIITNDIEEIEENEKPPESSNSTLAGKITGVDIILIIILSIGLPCVAAILLLLFIYQKKCKKCCKNCCNRNCKNKVKNDTVIDLENGNIPIAKPPNDNIPPNQNIATKKSVVKKSVKNVNRKERKQILLKNNKKMSDSNISNDTEETIERKTRN
jgi:hypothetical protein